jgi:hypothetical protein
MELRLSEVVFLRLSAGDPQWLSNLRWSPLAVAQMRQLNRLQARDGALTQQLAECRYRFSEKDWASLQAWLRRAEARASSATPQRLAEDPEALRVVRCLLKTRRQRTHCGVALERLLGEEEDHLHTRALQRLTDPSVRLIVASASADFTSSLGQWINGGNMSRKERRRLARTLCALLARSAYKSCPLAFIADTGILHVHGGRTSRIQPSPDCYVAMRPNQSVSNQLITVLRPTERYLEELGLLHLSASAWLDEDRLLWWRAMRTEHGLRERLDSLRPPPRALAIIQRAADGTTAGQLAGDRDQERDLTQHLVHEGILAREDLVTPLDNDPWSKIDAALHGFSRRDANRSELRTRYLKARRHARHFTTPQRLDAPAAPQVIAALDRLRELGQGVPQPDRAPGNGVAVDTYRSISGDLSRDHQASVRRAVDQYFRLAGLAYPLTPTCRKREHFLAGFRDKYGDDRPVGLDRLLIDDWQLVDDALSFLLRPDDFPMHPDSDLIWPDPGPHNDGAYADCYRSLCEAASSGQPHYEIDPVDTEPAVLRNVQPVMDAICRLGRDADGHVDVLVESATATGRLTDRHLHALASLDSHAGTAVSKCHSARAARTTSRRSSGAEPVLIVASHTIARLQNLSAVHWAGELLLPVTEPAPAPVGGRILRYSELYVRFETGSHSFVVTRGPGGPRLDFHWPSPLSPSFNRRLHFLRFLTLATKSVLTMPRWLRFEGSEGGHVPRLQAGPLVLSPQRWSVPRAWLRDCVAAPSRAGRYAALRALQDKLLLPDEIFVYTSDRTRPAFVDLAAPWGAETALRLVRQGGCGDAGTILFEERFPSPGHEIVRSLSGSCSLIFQCSLTVGAAGEASDADS